LHRGSKHIADIAPEPGMLVTFRGDLTHQVTRLEASAPAPTDDLTCQRASLVCEQYAFAPPVLERLPSLQVKSRARFDAFLRAATARKARTFVVD
jgi:hypothetical protein